MDKFAIYLPQFHEIKENNEWWGEGFTEWTHVKAAKPLFNGHCQPVVPLNNNYYNLMNKDVVVSQVELAKEHGINGFIYYHYYFCGKLLMEKPAENFLKWKDIQHKFFFCWANHTWYKACGNDKKILIEQKYGDVSSWEIHFKYLLQFFKDERYEKKDNKPVFMIYVGEFNEKKEMMDYFDRRCKEEGFDGIYVIETFREDPRKKKIVKRFEECLSNQTEEIFMREPSVSSAIFINRNPIFNFLYRAKWHLIRNVSFIPQRVRIVDGNDLFDIMINMDYEKYFTKKIVPGLCFSWDNTPRHAYNGYIITPPSKDRYKKYMKKVEEKENLYINAWNEWAEGMMLEPTVQAGEKYLDWIKEES